MHSALWTIYRIKTSIEHPSFEILADLSHLGLVSFFGLLFRPSILQQFFNLLIL
jgi:hypothetical protein